MKSAPPPLDSERPLLPTVRFPEIEPGKVETFVQLKLVPVKIKFNRFEESDSVIHSAFSILRFILLRSRVPRRMRPSIVDVLHLNTQKITIARLRARYVKRA
jgi:hypothetical protein